MPQEEQEPLHARDWPGVRIRMTSSHREGWFVAVKGDRMEVVKQLPYGTGYVLKGDATTNGTTFLANVQRDEFVLDGAP